nr:MAG TPA: hypothetical protein [Caudoviricetes sp.]
MIVKINVMKRYETLIVVCRGHFFIRKKPWFSKAFCVVLALKNERKKILTIRAT